MAFCCLATSPSHIPQVVEAPSIYGSWTAICPSFIRIPHLRQGLLHRWSVLRIGNLVLKRMFEPPPGSGCFTVPRDLSITPRPKSGTEERCNRATTARPHSRLGQRPKAGALEGCQGSKPAPSTAGAPSTNPAPTRPTPGTGLQPSGAFPAMTWAVGRWPRLV